jgi:hypothetical protein
VTDGKRFGQLSGGVSARAIVAFVNPLACLIGKIFLAGTFT